MFGYYYSFLHQKIKNSTGSKNTESEISWNSKVLFFHDSFPFFIVQYIYASKDYVHWEYLPII